MKNLKELKVEAERIRSMVGEGQRLRWPSPFKAHVLEAVEEIGDLKAVAKAIGISHQTLYGWQPKPAEQKSKFQEVKIVDDEPAPGLTLAWGENLEVRGLSFEQFTTLLREGLL